MYYNQNITNSKKNENLTFQERFFIKIRIKYKGANYKLDKVLNTSINTVLNEILPGIVNQIKLNKKLIDISFKLVIEFTLKIEKVLKENTRF